MATKVIDAVSREKCLAVCKTSGIKVVNVTQIEEMPPSLFLKSGKLIFLLLGVFALLTCFITFKDSPNPSLEIDKKGLQRETVELSQKNKKLKVFSGRKWTPNVELKATANVKPPEVETQDVINLKELNRKFFGTPIFKHSSENTIAGILCSVPGDRFVIDQLDPGFDKDFEQSLSSAIEIFDDDPDDIKEQKQSVIEAKKLLSEVLSKGESPGSALSAIIKDLNEIADYREKLEDNIRLLCNEASEEDIKVYLDEANKVLAEYNARKIEISPRRWQRIQRRLESETKNQGVAK